jgi:hypothetical protein
MMVGDYGDPSGRTRGDFGYCRRSCLSHSHPRVLRHDPTASLELVTGHSPRCSPVARGVVDHVLSCAISHSGPEGTLGSRAGFQTSFAEVGISDEPDDRTSGAPEPGRRSRKAQTPLHVTVFDGQLSDAVEGLGELVAVA